jgi:hypothetical protein
MTGQQHDGLDAQIEQLARLFPEPSRAERTGETPGREIHPDTGEAWEPWLVEHWAAVRGYAPDQIEKVGGSRLLAELYASELPGLDVGHGGAEVEAEPG